MIFWVWIRFPAHHEDGISRRSNATTEYTIADQLRAQGCSLPQQETTRERHFLEVRHRLADCQPVFPIGGSLARSPATGRGDRHRTVDCWHLGADQRVERALLQCVAG